MIYEFKEQDAYDFSRHIRARVKPFGDELKFTQYCPYCSGGKNHDRDTFSINLKTGQFKCLRASCSVQGNMLTLAKDFDFSLGIEMDEYYRPRKQYKKLKTPKEPIIPKPKATEYLLSRGISEEITKKYEITIHVKHDNTLVFPFFDERGLLQYVKYRDTEFFPGKTYIDCKGKEESSPKEWMEKDCKPILFGMKQCNDKFDRLVITEGQLDSLSVAESGIENAVSVPGGMNNFRWVPYCWNWVCQFEEVIVFGDFEKGSMTLLEDIKKRFPNKIRYVQEKDYQGCKDANALLQKSGKAAVRQAIENADIAPIKRVVQYADIRKKNFSKIHKIKTGFRRLDGRILNGGLYAGQLIILTGKRGKGKSTVAGQIMAEAINQGNNVFSYSGELPDFFFKEWMDRQLAGPQNVIENHNMDGSISRFVSNSTCEKIDEWVRNRFFIYDNNCIDDEEMIDLLKIVSDAVMKFGINLVVIDNLMTALDEDMEIDEYRAQARFVKKLAKLAKRLEIVIILIAHPKKNKFTTDENDAVSGSSKITDAADLVITYKSGKDDERDGVDTRWLSVSKNRWFGHLTRGDGVQIFYDEKSLRLRDAAGSFDEQFGWDKSDGFVPVEDMDLVFE